MDTDFEAIPLVVVELLPRSWYRWRMGFEIVIHGGVDVIEVVYPPEPSLRDVAEYLVGVRRVIDERQGRPWSCLVDQRALRVMDPALVQALASLNAYAQQHHMVRSARIVAPGAGAQQAERVAQAAGLAVEVRTFETREEALAWLVPV